MMRMVRWMRMAWRRERERRRGRGSGSAMSGMSGTMGRAKTMGRSNVFN